MRIVEPRVSVVMSVFNGAASIERTVDSLATQDEASFEIVIVDDGSTDETPELLGRIARGDKRVRMLRQPNLGLTRALVNGCLEARGEFIARQDCGDISLPGRLRKQADVLASTPNLAFVSCSTLYTDIDGEFLFEHSGSGIARSPMRIIDLSAPHGVIDGPSHHGSVMFRRRSYLSAGGYRAEFYFGQDWDLWYRLAEAGDFMILPERLLQVSIAAGDISATYKDVQEALSKLSLEALRRRLAGESDAGTLELAAQHRPGNGTRSRQSRISDGCYFLGECLRRNGNRAKAEQYFRQAIHGNPANIKAWLRWVQVRVGGQAQA